MLHTLTPRIALIHALRDSIEPSRAAFSALWPAARIFNLVDDSLSVDLAEAGRITPAITERFLTLARYADGTGANGILFTCSAFGGPIDACRAALTIPVLKPNEAALDAALAAGPRIGLLATFPATLVSMTAELKALAAQRGTPVEVTTAPVVGALAALQSGDAARHDALVAAAAAKLPPLDALLLTQFSLARAAAVIAPVPGRMLITTPESAVARLMGLVNG